MLMKKSRLALSGFVLVIALGAGQAYAADAKQIADSLVALVAADGKAQATYDGATASGDDVTITNFKVTGEGDTMTVPSIVITGAQPRDKGGFTAAAMSMDGATMTTSEQSDVSWQTASGRRHHNSLRRGGKGEGAYYAVHGLQACRRGRQGRQARGACRGPGVSAKVTVDDKGTPTDFTSNVVSLKLPLELIEDEQQRAVITSLGYTEPFVINMTIDGGYQTAGDDLDIRSFQPRCGQCPASSASAASSAACRSAS